MVVYMSEEDSTGLCACYRRVIVQAIPYKDIACKRLTLNLKALVIMHFGWNIGKLFSKKAHSHSHIHQECFCPYPFVTRDLTIERKKSHTESVLLHKKLKKEIT